MDFIDLQMTLTVVLILTGAAVAIFFDYRRKQRPQAQPQRIDIRNTDPQQRSTTMFDAVPIDLAPAKRLAPERLREPLVATATASRPPVQSRMERETVTLEMASPSPAAPSRSTQIQTAITPLAFTLPAVTVDAILWERLLSSQPKQNLIPSAHGDLEPIDKMPAPPTLGSANGWHVPSSNPLGGMIQHPALEELLESQEPFTGLVVSIGINDSDSSMWHSQGLMQSVGNYISGLLRESDFSCRTAYDEFVIVCRGELGAQSQRRLNHISELLWDYQLRGIGACSILFSWGGVQVQDQPLAEAIASATERMRETKRSGRFVNSALAHRQAV
jgi:hypothetical protein